MSPRLRQRRPVFSRQNSGLPRSRRGFTLIEAVVAGVILSVLAAVTIPQVVDALNKKKVQDTYDILQEVHYAFSNSDQTGFLNVVRSGATVSTSSVVPGRLSELVNPVISNTATMPNSCGGTFQTTTVASTWTSFGPFLARAVSTVDGLRTPIGNIQNTLNRSQAVQGTFTTPVYIQLQINNVDPNDAAALDVLVDGVAGSTAGVLTYTTASNVSTVLYNIPIVNRC